MNLVDSVSDFTNSFALCHITLRMWWEAGRLLCIAYTNTHSDNTQYVQEQVLAGLYLVNSGDTCTGIDSME